MYILGIYCGQQRMAKEISNPQNIPLRAYHRYLKFKNMPHKQHFKRICMMEISADTWFCSCMQNHERSKYSIMSSGTGYYYYLLGLLCWNFLLSNISQWYKFQETHDVINILLYFHHYFFFRYYKVILYVVLFYFLMSIKLFKTQVS